MTLYRHRDGSPGLLLAVLSPFILPLAVFVIGPLIVGWFTLFPYRGEGEVGA